jgi:hypothetical protein
VLHGLRPVAPSSEQHGEAPRSMVEEEADLWGPHVSEWRGKHTKHLCTNTVRQWGPTSGRRIKW